MAHALQIDTLAFAKKLRAAGADEKLADAIVEGITAADTSELATKADVAALGTELRDEIADVKADLAALGTELRSEIAGVETRLGGEINGLKQEIQLIHGELKWIKIIGAAIAASTVLPMMADGAAKILEFYK